MKARNTRELRQQLVEKIIEQLLAGWEPTVRLQQYQDVVLRTDGRLFKDRSWRSIVGRKLAPGVYKLELRDDLDTKGKQNG